MVHLRKCPTVHSEKSYAYFITDIYWMVAKTFQLRLNLRDLTISWLWQVKLSLDPDV